MMLKDLKQIFSRLGFTKHASAVYDVTREHGPLLATNVVSMSKIHRPAVYRALRELLGAKLISAKKSGKRIYYAAEKPDRILALFLKDLENVSAAVKKYQPAKSDSGVMNNAVKFYHGPAGVRAVFDDVINRAKRGDTFYRYTSERDLAQVNSFLSPDYRKRRDSKRLERLVISNPGSGMQKRRRLERFIKFIPPEADPFNQNIIQLIYGSRVAFIDLNTLLSIIIDNSALADFQKIIFKQLYKKL